jgi:hypothetical protein
MLIYATMNFNKLQGGKMYRYTLRQNKVKLSKANDKVIMKARERHPIPCKEYGYGVYYFFDRCPIPPVKNYLI